MSFVIVEYVVDLNRDEVIKLIIDNEKVEKTTRDGEQVVLMGSGTHRKVPNLLSGGFNHVFYTSVEFKNHDKYLWCSVTLTLTENNLYTGKISPEI